MAEKWDEAAEPKNWLGPEQKRLVAGRGTVVEAASMPAGDRRGKGESDELVVLGQACLLSHPGRHPTFGKQLAEEVLPALLAGPYRHSGERDRHGQDGAVEPELGDRGRIGQEVEGAPRAGQHAHRPVAASGQWPAPGPPLAW